MDCLTDLDLGNQWSSHRMREIGVVVIPMCLCTLPRYVTCYRTLVSLIDRIINSQTEHWTLHENPRPLKLTIQMLVSWPFPQQDLWTTPGTCGLWLGCKMAVAFKVTERPWFHLLGQFLYPPYFLVHSSFSLVLSHNIHSFSAWLQWIARLLPLVFLFLPNSPS